MLKGLGIVASFIMLFCLSGCMVDDGSRQLTPGMSQYQVMQSIGKPDAVKVTGEIERWYYEPYMVRQQYQTLEVTFDNGRVSSFINPGAEERKMIDLTGIPPYVLPGTDAGQKPKRMITKYWVN